MDTCSATCIFTECTCGTNRQSRDTERDLGSHPVLSLLVTKSPLYVLTSDLTD